MKKRIRKNTYIIIIVVLFLSITIGYSYLFTNANMQLDVTVPKYTPKSNEIASNMSKVAVSDNVSSDYVTGENGIDFSQISSDTNGKGIYMLSETANDPYPIYYYRGEADNRIIFAGFCWRIVRTTSTGGVKIIYDGEPDANNYCKNTHNATDIGTVTYNTTNNNNTYAGFMTGDANSELYEEVHSNLQDSNMKDFIDTWYEENLISYESKLEDTIWCNDRSVSTGTGIGSDDTEFGGFERANIFKPTLACINDNDKFTKSSSLGNTKLEHPIATITADELIYAGAVYGTANEKFYLHSGQNYWTMTPAKMLSQQVYSYGVSYSGALDEMSINYTFAVRPTVSLGNNVSITKGSGTQEDPFIVE